MLISVFEHVAICQHTAYLQLVSKEADLARALAAIVAPLRAVPAHMHSDSGIQSGTLGCFKPHTRHAGVLFAYSVMHRSQCVYQYLCRLYGM
jgi:hypothetical protein